MRNAVDGRSRGDNTERRMQGSGEPMTGPELHESWGAWLAPLRVSFWRAAAEGIGVWIILGLLSGREWWNWGARTHLSVRDIFLILTWLGLFCWPAWRLRPIRGGRWWGMLGRGLARMLLLGLLFATILTILASIDIHPWIRGTAPTPSGFFGATIGFTFGLSLFRAIVLLAMRVGRWVRRKLSRQLMVSHLTVIMITFVGLIAVGVVCGLTLILQAIPDARSQATAAAYALQPPKQATKLDPRKAQGVLEALILGQIHPDGVRHSLLLLIAPWQGINRRTLLLDRQGHILAQTGNENLGDAASTWCERLPAHIPFPPALWRQLGPEALAGNGSVVTAPVPAAFACGRPGEKVTDQLMAAAPVYVQGKPGAVAVVQGLKTSAILSPNFNVLGFALGVFGAVTILVLTVTVLPTLAISSLAGFIFARGQTRRLVAVSRAAEAIAAGDLSRRAPVTAHNEIGRLAQDFNRMAAHQEQAIAELRQARTQAEQALHARQELVASVSHELRTPIAIVQAHLESLQMPGAAPTAARSGQDICIPGPTLEALQHEMGRLASLVDDLFSLARVETGALQVQCAPIDTAALVHEVAGLLRPLAQRESAIALTVETPPGLPPAMADADRLRQILSNLVRNAVRHTPEGGIISISVRAEMPWVVVAVADTGEGIPAEHLSHIFERFYRVDQARSRASGGAGLGLAIVREFVEEMGGRVTVESVPGEGSCFRVFLRTAGAPTPSPDRVPTPTANLAT